MRMARKAQKNAEIIAKFLKENYGGQSVTKASLKAKFSLPNNRSVLVWEYLRTYGIDVEHQTIIVPATS